MLFGELSCVRSTKRVFLARTTAALGGALALLLHLTPMCSIAESPNNDALPNPTDPIPAGVWILVDGKYVPVKPLHLQYDEREVREGTVRVYETAMRVDLRGVAVPELDMKLLRRRDITALKPVLDSLSKYGFPIYDMDIRYVPWEDRALYSPVLIELEQFIDEHRVGFLKLFSIKEGGNDPRSRITGLLINPHLPQLNRKNWMPEKAAIQMATDLLRLKADGFSAWFLHQVEEGKIAGTEQIDVTQTEEGYAVFPIYEVVGNRTVVRINLYDGSMETFENSPVF